MNPTSTATSTPLGDALALMKNLSRPDLEALLGVGFEQIYEEDRVLGEAGNAPRYDSLYEVAKNLVLQASRRDIHEWIPGAWARLEDYFFLFEEELEKSLEQRLVEINSTPDSY